MDAILKLALIQERLKQDSGPRKLKRAVVHLLTKKDKALIKNLVQAVQDAKEWEILNILSEEERTNPALFDEGFQIVQEEDIAEEDDWEYVNPVDEQ
jgi:DNA-binding MarR family transcriptional regulator